jgi:hypothetical protein
MKEIGRKSKSSWNLMRMKAQSEPMGHIKSSPKGKV